MEEYLLLIILCSVSLIAHFISEVSTEISSILFGLSLVGIALIHNNINLIFLLLIMGTLLILRIKKLNVKNTLNL